MELGSAILIGSFLWLPIAAVALAGLAVSTFLFAKRAANTAPAATANPRVSTWCNIALLLSVVLTIGGAPTALSVGMLSDADLSTVAAALVAVLDALTIWLFVLLIRILVTARNGDAGRLPRRLAAAYATALVGVFVVLGCVAVVGLPHVA